MWNVVLKCDIPMTLPQYHRNPHPRPERATIAPLHIPPKTDTFFKVTPTQVSQNISTLFSILCALVLVTNLAQLSNSIDDYRS